MFQCFNSSCLSNVFMYYVGLNLEVVASQPQPMKPMGRW